MKLFKFNKNITTAWSTVNNVAAGKGRGGIDTQHLKIAPNETKTVFEMNGSAIINRIWMTLNFPDLENHPDNEQRNRSLVINIFWDNSETPAVSAPFGDFFGHIMGRDIPFHNELFADSVGKSYLCFIPMPFKEGVKISVTNNFTEDVVVYHEINMSILNKWDEDNLYFHACYHRENPGILGKPFELLPQIKGSGRFLGSHIGINTNPIVNSRWTEGTTNIYLDGDSEHPSLMSGAIEDYYGSAWAWDTCFCHPHSGRLLRDVKEGTEIGAHSFYRYHIADPVYFKEECRVTMGRSSGLTAKDFRKMVDENQEVLNHIKTELPLDEIDKLENWWDLVLFDKDDDWSGVAFFYLNKPDNILCP